MLFVNCFFIENDKINENFPKQGMLEPPITSSRFVICLVNPILKIYAEGGTLLYDGLGLN